MWGGQERAWQTGRAGGGQAEEALPGWACLGRIHAGGRNLFGKGETNPERDGDPTIQRLGTKGGGSSTPEHLVHSHSSRAGGFPF